MTRKILSAYTFSVIIAIATAVFLLAYQEGSASGSGRTSAWVQIEGQQKQTGVTDGQIVGETERKNDECESPKIDMGMLGDVKSISVAINPDACEVYIVDVVENTETDVFDQPAPANGPQQSANEYGWRVESNARLRGAILETLTLTTSWVEFNTVSFSGPGPLSDGDGDSDCDASQGWGYNLDQCYKSSSFNSTASVWASALGVYSNDNFDSFGHYTYAKSKGIGDESGADRFETVCYGHSLPFFPAHLVCEEDWEFLGVQ